MSLPRPITLQSVLAHGPNTTTLHLAELADARDAAGLEFIGFAQLISSLSVAAEGGVDSVLGDALAGLTTVDFSTSSSLSPLQLCVQNNLDPSASRHAASLMRAFPYLI